VLVRKIQEIEFAIWKNKGDLRNGQDIVSSDRLFAQLFCTILWLIGYWVLIIKQGWQVCFIVQHTSGIRHAPLEELIQSVLKALAFDSPAVDGASLSVTQDIIKYDSSDIVWR
jgi:hypothetical protein